MSLVSVVMTVYNAERFLKESIESILKQSLKDFEFIIINDGSTDKSTQILEHYAALDSRIKVLHQKNQGVTRSLNTGVSLAHSRYIARMDADDISEKTRLEKQLSFLENHEEYVLTGTDYAIIDTQGVVLETIKVANQDQDIRLLMRTSCPIAHGSVMYRREVFNLLEGYSLESGSAEDYDLWARMIGVGKVHIIPTTLFRWRLSDTNITTVKAHAVEESAEKVRRRLNTGNPVFLDNFDLINKKYVYSTPRYTHLLNSCSKLCVYQLKRKKFIYALKNIRTLLTIPVYGKTIVLNRILRILSKGRRGVGCLDAK